MYQVPSIILVDISSRCSILTIKTIVNHLKQSTSTTTILYDVLYNCLLFLVLFSPQYLVGRRRNYEKGSQSRLMAPWLLLVTVRIATYEVLLSYPTRLP